MTSKMQHLFTICTKEKLLWIVMVCWNLRNRRNKWVWNRISVSEFGVQSMARGMLTDWKRYQVEKSSNASGVASNSRRWTSPGQGSVKVNTDVATFLSEGHVGIGMVIRDCNGVLFEPKFRKFLLSCSRGKWKLWD